MEESSKTTLIRNEEIIKTSEKAKKDNDAMKTTLEAKNKELAQMVLDTKKSLEADMTCKQSYQTSKILICKSKVTCLCSN
jgi:hypothetical protein